MITFIWIQSQTFLIDKTQIQCIRYMYSNKMGLTTEQAKASLAILALLALLATKTVNKTIKFVNIASFLLQSCGNGLKEATEQCDDGNSKDTDGCSSTCQRQQGFKCKQEPPSSKSVCFKEVWSHNRVLAGQNGTSVQVCGNAILETGEECDDGNVYDGDGCSSTCKIQDGFRCSLVYASSLCRAICGDSFVVGKEQCDDGNVKSGDGCSSACKVEAGYSCNYSNVSHKSICCINGTEYNQTTDSCANKTSNGTSSNATNATDSNNTISSNLINSSTTNTTVDPSKTTSNVTADNATSPVNNQTNTNATTNSTSNSTISNETLPANTTINNQTNTDNTTNQTTTANATANNQTNTTTNNTINNITNTTSNPQNNTNNTTIQSSSFVVSLFIKIPGQNSLLVSLSSSARLLFQSSQLIHANFPYESYQIKQSSPNRLQLQFNYNVSLNDYSYLSFTINNQTVFLPPVTANNLALKCYPPEYYSIYNTFSVLMPVFAYVILFLLVLTFLFSSKLIAVQTLLIFQFTYGGLLMMRKIESIMYPFKELWLFDGFNIRNPNEAYVPPRIGALGMTSDFLSNFNISIAICLLPLAIGAVVSFRRLRLHRYRAAIVGEWQLSALLICIQQLVFAFVVNIQYSQAPAFGIVVGLLLLLLYLFYMYRLYDRKKQSHLTTKNQFGDFKQFFHVNFVNFYVFSMAYRLSLSLVLVLMSDSIVSQSLALVLSVLWAAVIIIKRPYKRSARLIPIVNSLIMVLISIFYLYQRNKADSPQINFATFMPIALICILGLTCIFNTIYAGMNFQSLRKRRGEMERRMKEHNKSSIVPSLFDISHQTIDNGMSVVISDLTNNSHIISKEFVDPANNHPQSTDFKVVSSIKPRQLGPNNLQISQEYERQKGVYTLQGLQQERKQDLSSIQANDG